MLTHPTLDQLNQLGLLGMAGAFGEMIDADACGATIKMRARRQSG